MNILIACADSLMGRQMAETLECIRDGRDKTRPKLSVGGLYLFPSGASSLALAAALCDCDAALCLPGSEKRHLADCDAFFSALQKNKKPGLAVLAYAPDAFSGEQGEALERRLEAASDASGRRGAVCRLTHPVGKWMTEAENAAARLIVRAAKGGPWPDGQNDAPYTLTFAEDAADALLSALEGLADGEAAETAAGQVWQIEPVSHGTSLREIAALTERFGQMPWTLVMPPIPEGSLQKKLLSLYLSFLPPEKAVYPLNMRRDARGSFTEWIKTADHGQVSVNVSKPGVTKGEHWHHGKWEIFLVVSGRALIRERKIGTDEVVSFEVSGEDLQAVRMLPGYTHSIVNLSDTQDLVTVMWANECFDPAKPDTFFEKV